MKKWLKRIGLLIGVFLILLGLFLSYSISSGRGGSSSLMTPSQCRIGTAG
ncbi:MAG: hypothetical protein KF831_01240 [Acidobacteria bacterium]|nr:hypothetical protein [Acidobacteriota bacterium]